MISQGLFYFQAMEWSIKDIYDKVYQGRRIVIDSRKVEVGDIFIALQGERQDGNQYALKALDNGAAFAIIDAPTLKGKDDRLIYVEDALVALQDLAFYHRSQLSIPVIGVTGSNGKTTTKELLVSVLSQSYRIAATKGNYNNHIGVPLTILDTPLDTEILILEMGTNQPGDIAQLCHLGKPTHGIITNIGDAHLEKLIDRDGVLQEKGALYRHVMKGSEGVFFLFDDDGYLTKLAQGIDEVISFGSKTSRHITSVNTSIGSSEISISLENQVINAQSSLTGQHNMYNILAAAVIGFHFGISIEEISKGIASYIPSNMRSQMKITDRNRLLIDAYNANPSSMSASIFALEDAKEDLVLILGDMLELGLKSADYHQKIIRQVEDLDVKNLVVVGPIFTEVVEGKYRAYHDVDDLIKSGLLSEIRNSLVLIKGSRGIRLEKTIDHL